MPTYASSMRRLLAIVLVGWVLVVGGPAAAIPESCFQGGGVADTEECTSDYPGFGTDMDTGIPGWFVGLFLLVGVGAVVGAIYRVGMARDMATKAGMDPRRATEMTLLEEQGLTATYLAANLRQQSPPVAAVDGPERTVEERLAELDALRAKGVVTQAEYDERRAAILGSI